MNFETGYDYFGDRFYDSEPGRWLSVDPLADVYPELSPYNYVSNNLLRYIDPKGLGHWEPDPRNSEEKIWNPYDEDIIVYGNRYENSIYAITGTIALTTDLIENVIVPNDIL